MTEKEKMLSGQLYLANDSQLKAERAHNQRRLRRYNRLLPCQSNTRYRQIKKVFSKVGPNCSVYPPFYCDYGYNIQVGDNFFANRNCTILDIAPVFIGNNVMLGPGVVILAASHPLDYSLRKIGYGLGFPVTIGDNVWIGAGSIINPGVQIGNNTVIGLGSIVTKDIPSNVIVAGNPCRVIRSI